MPETRLPVAPRIGYALLTVVLTLLLVAFVLLSFVVDGERFKFLAAAAGVLFGISWVRGTRRTWIEKQRAVAPGAPEPAPGPQHP